MHELPFHAEGFNHPHMSQIGEITISPFVAQPRLQQEIHRPIFNLLAVENPNYTQLLLIHCKEMT